MQMKLTCLRFETERIWEQNKAVTDLNVREIGSSGQRPNLAQKSKDFA